MTATKRFAGNAILDKFIDILTPFSGELNLRGIGKGGVNKIPAPENINDWLNMILFDLVNMPHIPQAGQYKIDYHVNCWGVRKWLDDEDIKEMDITFAERIADIIIEASCVSLSSEDPAILSVDTEDIDYDSPESTFFIQQVESNISVIKIPIIIKSFGIRRLT